jgi:hypothetical protein
MLNGALTVRHGPFQGKTGGITSPAGRPVRGCKWHTYQCIFWNLTVARARTRARE